MSLIMHRVPCLPNDQLPLTGMPDSSALCDTSADNVVKQHQYLAEQDLWAALKQHQYLAEHRLLLQPFSENSLVFGTIPF